MIKHCFVCFTLYIFKFINKLKYESEESVLNRFLRLCGPIIFLRLKVTVVRQHNLYDQIQVDLEINLHALSKRIYRLSMELICRALSRRIYYINKTNTLRTIMTSSSRTEKAMEQLQTNPYYEKYATKISKLQETSPEEFLSRVEQQEEKRKKKAEAVKERQFTSLLKPKKVLPSAVDVEDEPLDKVMKTELIQDKDVEEIKAIWAQYHLQKEVISATISAKEYDIIYEESKKYPIFIFPLPRSQGYEFIMSEFRRNAVHFTPLICYQVHKENAPECLTIKHYTDLKDTKDIVLMRGEYDKNVIDAKEAQCLANQFQLYYNQKDAQKTKLLEQFTSKPDEFKHIDLIKQIESLTL